MRINKEQACFNEELAELNGNELTQVTGGLSGCNDKGSINNCYDMGELTSGAKSPIS